MESVEQLYSFIVTQEEGKPDGILTHVIAKGEREAKSKTGVPVTISILGTITRITKKELPFTLRIQSENPNEEPSVVAEMEMQDSRPEITGKRIFDITDITSIQVHALLNIATLLLRSIPSPTEDSGVADPLPGLLRYALNGYAAENVPGFARTIEPQSDIQAHSEPEDLPD